MSRLTDNDISDLHRDSILTPAGRICRCRSIGSFLFLPNILPKWTIGRKHLDLFIDRRALCLQIVLSPVEILDLQYNATNMLVSEGNRAPAYVRLAPPLPPGPGPW